MGQNPQDLAPDLVPRKIQDFNKQIIPNNGYPQIQNFLNTNLEANQEIHLQAKLEVSGLAASEMKVPLRASENPRGVLTRNPDLIPVLLRQTSLKFRNPK